MEVVSFTQRYHSPLYNLWLMTSVNFPLFSLSNIVFVTSARAFTTTTTTTTHSIFSSLFHLLARFLTAHTTASRGETLCRTQLEEGLARAIFAQQEKTKKKLKFSSLEGRRAEVTEKRGFGGNAETYIRMYIRAGERTAHISASVQTHLGVVSGTKRWKLPLSLDWGRVRDTRCLVARDEPANILRSAGY